MGSATVNVVGASEWRDHCEELESTDAEAGAWGRMQAVLAGDDTGALRDFVDQSVTPEREAWKATAEYRPADGKDGGV